MLSVFVFCLAATITPGPNNVMLVASGVNFGARRTLRHGLGIALGFPLMMLALGLGLGKLFAAYPLLHSVIKWAGVTYLLYLAWRIAGAGRPARTANEQTTRPLGFFQAAAFQWVNPKAWVIASALVATFSQTREDVWLIVAVSTLACCVSVSVWLFFGVAMQRLLRRDQWACWFNRAMAALLILSVLPMAATSGW